MLPELRALNCSQVTCDATGERLPKTVTYSAAQIRPGSDWASNEFLKQDGIHKANSFKITTAQQLAAAQAQPVVLTQGSQQPSWDEAILDLRKKIRNTNAQLQQQGTQLRQELQDVRHIAAQLEKITSWLAGREILRLAAGLLSMTLQVRLWFSRSQRPDISCRFTVLARREAAKGLLLVRHMSHDLSQVKRPEVCTPPSNHSFCWLHTCAA